MSHDYLEIVRRVYDEWGRGNFVAGTERFDPHTLLVLAPEFPESGGYCGPGEIDKYMRGFLGAWDNLVIEGESFVAKGDSVVVEVRQHGAGKASGAPVELRYCQVWSFRGATVLRMENVMTRDAAMEAVGLAGQGNGP